MSKLQEDIRICLAASKGKTWYWSVNPKHYDISLRSTENGGNIIMDFVRWGMQGAAPRFNEMCISSVGILERADKYFEVISGQEHNKAFYQKLNHPDAIFMAHFNPEKVLGLPDRIKELEDELDKEKKKV